MIRRLKRSVPRRELVEASGYWGNYYREWEEEEVVLQWQDKEGKWNDIETVTESTDG